MLKHLRRFAVTAAILVLVVPMAPTPAAAATNLSYPSELGRWWPGGAGAGTGQVAMKNSSGQKIGEYRLSVPVICGPSS